MNENQQPKNLAQRIRDTGWFIGASSFVGIMSYLIAGIKVQNSFICLLIAIAVAIFFYFGVSSFLAETLSKWTG